MMIHQVLTKSVRKYCSASHSVCSVDSDPASVFRLSESNLAHCGDMSSLQSLFQLDLEKEIPMKSFIFSLFDCD